MDSILHQSLEELRAEVLRLRAENTALNARSALASAGELPPQDTRASMNAEAALRIIENGFESVILLDANRQISYVSPNTVSLLGYTADELRASGLVAITHPEEQPTLLQFMDQVCVTPGITKLLSVRMRHQDGRWRWIERNSTNQLGNPAIRGVVINLHDVTERVLAEHALQRAVDRLEMLHTIDRAILEAHTPERIANVVLAHVRDLLGCARAAVVLYEADRGMGLILASSGTPMEALTPGARLPWFASGVEAMLRRGEIVIDTDLERAMLAHPARQALLAARIQTIMCVPLLAQGALIGTLTLCATSADAFSTEDEMIAREIANTLAIALRNAQLAQQVARQAAELREANAELARAGRLKDEFLASMSHELRTPLNAILGMSEVLYEQIDGPLNERQASRLHSIEESGRHLLALINDILDLAKIESGKFTLEPDALVVDDLCRSSLRMVAQTAHTKRISITSAIDSAVDRIQADPRRLKQILVNLLSNAVKFTPLGGQIGLEVRGDAERHQATFIVWDTGIGIAEDNLARLFQPFTQLDSSLSRQYAGTGLGLALVRRLAEAHGGSVSVESMPGAGSRFSVALPWVPLAAKPIGIVPAPSLYLARPAPLAANGMHPLILLAEDNTQNSDMLQDYLESYGYQVLVARDGANTLTLASERSPDLIVMDIQMPGMDGLEAIRHIRADAQLQSIPIVAVTALAMVGDRERCLQAGADDYLTKPISLSTLLARLSMLLRQAASGKHV